MQILTIIPTYNEKNNIKGLIERILNLDADIGVLVVDDNSEDGTGQIVDDLARSDQRISVIHRLGKKGRGLAGIEGFKYAAKQDVEYVIEMDGDFSHDPAYIPTFLEQIVNCDVVIGSRMVTGGCVEGRNRLRDAISYFARHFVQFLLRLNVLDVTSGFRCFRRDVLANINWDKFISRGPAIVEETLFYLNKTGARFKEIPIVFKKRKFGKSKLNVLKLLWVLLTLIRLRLFYA